MSGKCECSVVKADPNHTKTTCEPRPFKLVWTHYHKYWIAVIPYYWLLQLVIGKKTKKKTSLYMTILLEPRQEYLKLKSFHLLTNEMKNGTCFHRWRSAEPNFLFVFLFSSSKVKMALHRSHLLKSADNPDKNSRQLFFLPPVCSYQTLRLTPQRTIGKLLSQRSFE